MGVRQDGEPAQVRGPLASGLLSALSYYYVTSSVVFLGLYLGQALLKDSQIRGDLFDSDGDAWANWDGQWYKSIIQKGYFYDKTKHSSVVFFPAYPVVGWAVSRLTGLGTDDALLVTSNALLVATFFVLFRYCELKSPDDDGTIAAYTLVAMGAFPTSMFFRLNYSESLFLFLEILALYGMRRGWPLPAVAAVIGLGTATRPVGVGMVAVLALHALRRGRGRGRSRALRDLLVAIPVSFWGIAAYAAYLQVRFGDPLAFVRGQAAWNRRPEEALRNRALHLLTLEPIWSNLVPSSRGYWSHYEVHLHALFNMHIWDPLIFVAAVVLALVGCSRRWLDCEELATCAALLLIPYCTNGYTTYMTSMGRYSAAAIPIYFVIARLLAWVGGPMASALVGLGCFLLACFSALFAAWYLIL